MTEFRSNRSFAVAGSETAIAGAKRVRRRAWASVLAGAALAAAVAGWGARAGDDDRDREGRRVPGEGESLRVAPKEPAEAEATFRVHPEFEMRRVAEEPLVADPVSAVYDERGRLYVVEMRGYPFPEDRPTGKVRLLEDRDGDGRFETSAVFLDGLNWPTAALVHDGGVFIVASPDLIYAKDEDGDGIADRTEVIFTGFVPHNVQALPNNLAWGPDGWIYGATGPNGADLTCPRHPERPAVSLRGRDFRFHPETLELEAIAGGGQFGHAFDDWGRRFVCANSNHLRQVVMPLRYLERNAALGSTTVTIDIAADGGAAPVFRISEPEPWRLIRTRDRAADPEMRKRLPQSELVVTGFFTSATGVTPHRGTSLPEGDLGQVFMGDVGGNLIHRKRLAAKGGRLEGTRVDANSEVVASTDNWFRPVNFANTPNGTLLVLDMYRETIEHPWSIPEPLKARLDLTSGKDRGRLYELGRKGFERRERPALDEEDAAGLVARLADRDGWWRETAQRLILERCRKDAKAVEEFRGPLARLAAERPAARGRWHALNTMEALGILTDAGPILEAFKDPEPRVRELAARLAEPRLGNSAEARAALIGLTRDEDSLARLQAALSLGEVPAGVDESAVVEAFAGLVERDGADPWFRLAILSGIGTGGRTVALLEALAGREGFSETGTGRAWIGDLVELLGAGRSETEIAAALKRFAGEGGDPRRARAAALGLERGLRRAGRSLSETRDPEARALLDRLAEEALGRLRRGLEAGEPGADFPGDLELAGVGDSAGILEVAPKLLDAKYPPEAQIAGLRSLGGARGADEAIADRILGRWSYLSPGARREGVEILFARPERVKRLLDAAARGEVSIAELGLDRLELLRKHADATIREKAASLRANAPGADRAAVIARYGASLKLAGDAERGKAVYAKHCATCHQLDGEGKEVGPDLATIRNRSREDVLGHILDPNREIAPNYQTYAVETKEGQVLTGILAGETARALTLKRAEGVTDTIPRELIETVVNTNISLMPAGLESEIDPEAMADLLRFLLGAGPGGAPAGDGKADGGAGGGGGGRED